MIEQNYQDKYFILVVCGSKEHIDTLHFSIKALKKFSSHEAFVITDSNRNEIPIEYPNIIDIKTPAHYTHHQASIYLKTSIHRYLPKGNLYCYLDSDVVALSKEVDSIFNHFHSPITFCTDHCKLDEFSPSAVNCGCLERKDELMQGMNDFGKEQSHQLPNFNQYVKDSIQEIENLVSKSKENRWTYLIHQLRYFFSGDFYHLNNKYKLQKKTGNWYNSNNQILQFDTTNFTSYIEQKTGFSFSKEEGEWYTKEGIPLLRLKCSHLTEQIKDTFNLTIENPNWQHWNGGVFLFNDTSSFFLEDWHQATLAIFENENWKTRDQGALAYIVWKHCLQQHSTLPIKYNFIADYQSKTAKYLGNFCFAFGKKNESVAPILIHIYHHWGDESWKVWRDVKSNVSLR